MTNVESIIIWGALIHHLHECRSVHVYVDGEFNHKISCLCNIVVHRVIYQFLCVCEQRMCSDCCEAPSETEGQVDTEAPRTLRGRTKIHKPRKYRGSDESEDEKSEKKSEDLDSSKGSKKSPKANSSSFTSPEVLLCNNY